MAFDGTLKAPMPKASGTFNDLTGSLKAPMPVILGSFQPGVAFVGHLVAPFPQVNGLFNETWQGHLIAPMPKVSGTLASALVLSGKLKAPMPIINGQLGYAWYGHLVAPMPKMSGIFAGSVYEFNGALVAPMPRIFGTLIQGQTSDFTVLVMNLANKVVSEYQNYNFNSACKFNGVYLAADKSTGVHILSGDDDNGTPIDAYLVLGDSNFGVTNLKMCPEMLVNYFGDGLEVSVLRDQQIEMDDPDAIVNGPYDVPATFDNRVQTKRARFPKGYESGSWQHKIGNVNGGKFNIESIELPMEISRRRRN